MTSMNLSDIAIWNIIRSDYCCIISLISKSKAIKLIQNAALTKKENTIKHKNLLSPIKTSREILTFGGIKIEKNKFYRNKISVHLRDLNIEKVLV